ncbi:MAG: nucleotidyl transferase AbiEii/AbiGii toxin family protein [PVC group bacterium]
MIGDILSERIRDYSPANALEQENVLAELLQHFVIASLSRARFYSQAGFHGGTCLRILYGMNRFSEDLDFLLKEPNPDFKWRPYLDRILSDCRDEGIHFEVRDRSSEETAVKKAFIKTDSIGQILTLKLPFSRHATRKVRIKLEIDTNPPAGSLFETRYIDFPLTAAITTQTLKSGFATKSHALLCREYTKGRDWYDFLWYVSRKVVPDLALLGNALDQQGHWVGQGVRVTPEWYQATMKNRIETIDWDKARTDVMRFVVAREQESLALWGPDLFLHQLNRLAELN